MSVCYEETLSGFVCVSEQASAGTFSRSAAPRVNARCGGRALRSAHQPQFLFLFFVHTVRQQPGDAAAATGPSIKDQLADLGNGELM